MWGVYTWRARGVRAYNGVWGQSPQRDPGHSQGVRGKAPVGKFQDGHFEVNERKRRASQAPNHDQPSNPLLPSKNSPNLHQSQERPLAKVGWTCPPHSIPWRRPLLQQTIALWFMSLQHRIIWLGRAVAVPLVRNLAQKHGSRTPSHRTFRPPKR